MGLLCDHNITEYQPTDDLSNKPLKTIAEKLLKDIPFLDIKDVFYEGSAIRLAVPYEQLVLSPGQTVFDVLKSIAQGRGLYFWCNEKGHFIFGTPVSSKAPEYHFILEKNIGRTNVLEASKTTDITSGFSTIIVHSQSQDSDVDSVAAQKSLSVPDEFPFYKPKVVCINGDSKSAYYEANRFINLSKANCMQLQYLMPGHSFKGKNYKTNVMARVDDEENNVHGDFLSKRPNIDIIKQKNGPAGFNKTLQTGRSI